MKIWGLFHTLHFKAVFGINKSNGREFQHQKFRVRTGIEKYDYGARMQNSQLRAALRMIHRSADKIKCEGYHPTVILLIIHYHLLIPTEMSPEILHRL